MKRNEQQNHRAKAEQHLEAFLIEMLPDPYDFLDISVRSDFDGSDFTYSATITFILPHGEHKTYTFPLYGMNKSDMQALTIYSIRQLFKDQLVSPYGEDIATTVN